MPTLPDFSENATIADMDVEIEFYRMEDSDSGDDFYRVKYRFPSDVLGDLKEFRDIESGRPEFYGLCPSLLDNGATTDMYIFIPVGHHNHQKPIEEVERVAYGVADIAEEYLS